MYFAACGVFNVAKPVLLIDPQTKCEIDEAAFPIFFLSQQPAIFEIKREGKQYIYHAKM